MSSVLEGEARTTERMAQLSEMASSGLRVSQPSDDPAAYASIVDRNGQIATVKARTSAATTAGGDLDLAGNILDQATTLLQKARALAVEESNGTQSAASRADSATAVDAMVQQLLALGNTRGSSGYLFGGTNTGVPPFDAAGNYRGNAGVTHIEIADGVLAASNANGMQAFNAPGGRNVVADLQALSSALTTNNVAGIQTSIANLDASHTQMVAAQVNTGELADRLHSASTVMNGALTQMQISLASVADADFATTVSNLTATQTAYQAALQVNKQILSLALPQAG
jgi:flagellar hook-associated protein 3 FlgL